MIFQFMGFVWAGCRTCGSIWQLVGLRPERTKFSRNNTREWPQCALHVSQEQTRPCHGSLVQAVRSLIYYYHSPFQLLCWQEVTVLPYTSIQIFLTAVSAAGRLQCQNVTSSRRIFEGRLIKTINMNQALTNLKLIKNLKMP